MAPNITFASLCKYIAGNAINRRSIIKTFKTPADGPRKSYIAADSAIVAHLVDGAALPTGHDVKHVDVVLKAFPHCGWPPQGLTLTRPNPKQGKLKIAGVEISLSPTVLVARDGSRGAVRLYYAKPAIEGRPQLEPVTVAQTMSSLLFYYGKEHLGDSSYDINLCEVVCVRDGTVHTAPSAAHKNLLKLVEATCEEIRDRWDKI